jgi:hypothetical protein
LSSEVSSVHGATAAFHGFLIPGDPVLLIGCVKGDKSQQDDVCGDGSGQGNAVRHRVASGVGDELRARLCCKAFDCCARCR